MTEALVAEFHLSILLSVSVALVALTLAITLTNVLDAVNIVNILQMEVRLLWFHCERDRDYRFKVRCLCKKCARGN